MEKGGLMMSKIPIKLRLVIVFLLLLAAMICNILDIVHADKMFEKLKSVLELVSIFLTGIFYFYDNYNELYLLVNKIYRKFYVNTISWKCSYKLYTDNITDRSKFDELIYDYKEWIEGEQKFIVKKLTKLDPDKCLLRIEYKGRGRDLNLNFHASFDISYIELRYEASIAYKDSQDEFTSFKNLIQLLENRILSNRERKNTYQLMIGLEKQNPYYKGIIRTFDLNPLDYLIKIKDRESKGTVEVKVNKITFTSQDADFIEKNLTEYLILSGRK